MTLSRQHASLLTVAALAATAGHLTYSVFNADGRYAERLAEERQTAEAPPPQTPLMDVRARADGGDAKAMLLLAFAYADGNAVERSPEEAASWMRRAAESGQPLAAYYLGTYYERGRGLPADMAQAVHWYEAAAMRGNRKAMHNLAVAYARGQGVEPDLEQAVRWFKGAAELGLADSQFNLGVLYESGQGMPRSLPDAYAWYALANAAGDAEAGKRAETIRPRLSKAQKDSAETKLRDFQVRPFDPEANDPPNLGAINAVAQGKE